MVMRHGFMTGWTSEILLRACFVLCLTISLTLLNAAGAPSAAATPAPAGKTAKSVLSLDNDGTPVASFASPCTRSAGCANGLRIRWAVGACHDQRTYPPIAMGWFYRDIPTAKYWPIASPCGTGITLQWTPGGTLRPPYWVHAPLSNQDLVRFPTHANGATVFSYGGHNPVKAQWLRNGKVTSTFALPAADDAVWSAYREATPVSKQQAGPVPTVKLWGRVGSFTDATNTDPAPSNAYGVEFRWFLSQCAGSCGGNDVRGCRLANGTYWTDPPVMFEYTSHGALLGRLNLLTCPTDGSGNPINFSALDFTWAPNGSGGFDLSSAYGSNSVPQPPANTDGLYFESDLDDFAGAHWLIVGGLSGPLAHPAHVRLETWTG